MSSGNAEDVFGVFDFGEPLDVKAIIDFRDKEIWPAVNRLWHGDFVEESVIGDAACITKTFVDGEKRVTFSLDASHDTHEVPGEADVKVLEACFEVQELAPDKLAGLIESINRAMQESGIKGLLDPDDTGLEAWDTKRYTFDADDDNPLKIEETVELYDEDGEPVYDPNLSDHDTRKRLPELCDDFDRIIQQGEADVLTLGIPDTFTIKSIIFALGLSEEEIDDD